MANDKLYQEFKEAYNNFEVMPLSGDKLKKFYIENFAKELVDEISERISLSTSAQKLLVIGHRGCGKSTILNKVKENLDTQYFVIKYSALDVLNLMDIETIDLLLITYMQILHVMDQQRIPHDFSKLDQLLQFVKDRFSITDAGVTLLKTISFKIKVESETREFIRERLRKQIEDIKQKISEACVDINKHTKKDIIIIVDDLDKLSTDNATKMFIKDYNIVTLPEANIVYTFPLDTYYSASYNPIKDKYVDLFIPVLALKDENGVVLEKTYSDLQKLVLRRMNSKLIDDEALKILIESSGGLLRDLVQYMQDACFTAILQKKEKISLEIATEVFDEDVIDYIRLFDSQEFGMEVETIQNTKHKPQNLSKLVELLRLLFVLEYRGTNPPRVWFDLHPALSESLRISRDK